MKKVFFGFLFFLIDSSSIFAQPLLHPYNLDFGLSENGSMPLGWKINDSDKKLGFNAYSTDSLAEKNCFFLKITSSKKLLAFQQDTNSNKENISRGIVFQTFVADWFRGKNARFSAKITYKSKDTGDFLLLIVQSESPRNKLINAKFSDTIRNAKEDNFSVIASIDTNADLVRIGFALYGTSDAIIEECNFEPIIEKSTFQTKINLSNENLQNLKLLARIYGEARYFYPDSNLNFQFWENFLYKNIEDALTIRGKDEFIKKIQKDYSAIIPKFSISESYKGNNYQIISKPYKAISDTTKIMYNYFYRGGVSILQTDVINSKIKNIYESQRSAPALSLQILNVKNIVLKEINLSAKVKFTPFSPSGNALIALRFDDPNNYDLLNQLSQVIWDTTNGWADLSIKIEVPQNTAYIRLGLMMNGDGIVNFDNLQITAKDENDNSINLNMRNTDFEDPLIQTAIPAWVFPKYCKEAGYTMELDTINSFTGKYSLKLSSDTNYVKFYPPQSFFDEVYNNIEYSIPIQENKFIEKNITKSITNPSPNLTSNNAIARICTSIDLWNIYKHFGLKNIEDTAFDRILENTLINIANKTDENEFRKSLEEIGRLAGDLSFKIWNGFDKTLYFPYIKITFENDKFLIYSKNDKIPNGSQAITIEDCDLSNLKTEILKMSNRYGDRNESEINQKSIIENEILKMLAGKQNTELKIKFIPPDSKKPQTVSITRNLNKILDLEKPFFSIEIVPGLIYIDATIMTDKEFKSILPELEKAETNGIIFDFRGYSLLSEHILGFFSTATLRGGSTIIPQYISPFKLNIQNQILNAEISPLQKLKNKKIAFLMDSKTSSYSEYILSLAKINKIGTIIGSQSQGNFTESNKVMLPGYYFITMSGQYFTFEQEIDTHLPLKPDIEVQNTIESYLRNEDTQLKAAINYLKNQN
ncbi:MAG: hypothetical protein KBA52_08090 [Candidatus Kapabacteria bacterium]|nr:hypothetical protein [Candidatus Kapabacteria bacterium]